MEKGKGGCPRVANGSMNMLYVDICIYIYINIDVYLLLFLRLEEMSKSDLSAWRQRLASTCCVL